MKNQNNSTKETCCAHKAQGFGGICFKCYEKLRIAAENYDHRKHKNKPQKRS